MSRIGNKPITIPAGVEVKLDGNKFIAKGPKGQLERELSDEIKVNIDGTEITFERPNDLPSIRALHGTTRANVNNLIIGVSQGFEKKLELVGEFKRSYTVKGLTQKQKDKTVVKEENNKSSSTSTNTFRENSSVDTKKLSESDLETWAKTIYIKDNNRNSTRSDYSADVWLGNDNLAYVNVKRGDNTVAKYRVNSLGQLEQNSSGSSWSVVSSVYTE